MDLNNLPEEVKNKLLDSLTEGEDSKILCAEEQNKYVENFIIKNKIQVGYDGSIKWESNPGINKKVLMTEIFKRYKVWCVQKKIGGSNRLTKDELSAHFDAYVHSQRIEVLIRLRSKVGYHSKYDDGLKELGRFVEAMMPKSTDKERAFAKAVLHSFIWQVKRKISGKNVEHQIMPVLFSGTGLQGIGKSKSVEMLLQPLSDFTLHLQLTSLSDPFTRKAFGENFAVIFDEMAGANKTDIEAMKNAITAKVLSARGMRTQDMDTIPQNCTFIGTSNRRIADMIFDSSGMRRFAEIELKGKANLSIITGEVWGSDGTVSEHTNPIDFLKIWRSVKEDVCNPVLNIMEELTEHQNKLRTKSTYEQWLEDFELSPGETGNEVQKLFNHYSNWMESQGKKSGMRSRFLRELESLGFENQGRSSVKGVRDIRIGMDRDFLKDLK